MADKAAVLRLRILNTENTGTSRFRECIDPEFGAWHVYMESPDSIGANLELTATLKVETLMSVEPVDQSCSRRDGSWRHVVLPTFPRVDP